MLLFVFISKMILARKLCRKPLVHWIGAIQTMEAVTRKRVTHWNLCDTNTAEQISIIKWFANYIHLRCELQRRFLNFLYTILSGGESNFLIWFLILLFLKIQPQQVFDAQFCTFILLECRARRVSGDWTPKICQRRKLGLFLQVLDCAITCLKLEKNESTPNQYYAALGIQTLGRKDLPPLFRKSWFYLFNLMHCPTFSARPIPRFFQGLLKSQTWIPGAREMLPPCCLKLYPVLNWVSNLKIPFPLSHLYWGKLCQNQMELIIN